MARIPSPLAHKPNMLAIMTSRKILRNLQDSIESWRACNTVRTVLDEEDFGCALHEAIFIPLWTLASFPGEGGAEVAELGVACAAV